MSVLDESLRIIYEAKNRAIDKENRSKQMVNDLDIIYKALDNIEFFLGREDKEYLKYKNMIYKINLRNQKILKKTVLEVFNRINAEKLVLIDSSKIFLTFYKLLTENILDISYGYQVNYLIVLSSGFRFIVKQDEQNIVLEKMDIDAIKNIQKAFEEFKLNTKLREVIENYSLQDGIDIFEGFIKGLLQEYPELLTFPVDKLNDIEVNSMAVNLFKILDDIVAKLKIKDEVENAKIVPGALNEKLKKSGEEQSVVKSLAEESGNDDRIASLINNGDKIETSLRASKNYQSKQITKIFDERFNDINEGLLKALDKYKISISTLREAHLKSLLSYPTMLLGEYHTRVENTIYNIDRLDIKPQEKITMMITFYGLAVEGVLDRTIQDNKYDAVLAYGFKDIKKELYGYLMHLFDNSNHIGIIKDIADKDIHKAFSVVNNMISDVKAKYPDLFIMDTSSEIDKYRFDNIEYVLEGIARRRLNL